MKRAKSIFLWWCEQGV